MQAKKEKKGTNAGKTPEPQPASKKPASSPSSATDKTQVWHRHWVLLTEPASCLGLRHTTLYWLPKLLSTTLLPVHTFHTVLAMHESPHHNTAACLTGHSAIKHSKIHPASSMHACSCHKRSSTLHFQQTCNRPVSSSLHHG